MLPPFCGSITTRVWHTYLQVCGWIMMPEKQWLWCMTVSIDWQRTLKQLSITTNNLLCLLHPIVFPISQSRYNKNYYSHSGQPILLTCFSYCVRLPKDLNCTASTPWTYYNFSWPSPFLPHRYPWHPLNSTTSSPAAVPSQPPSPH